VSRDSILRAFAELLERVAAVSPTDVRLETRFADLGIDSLAMIELVVAAEDRFGVRIGDDDVERLKTVEDAVDYVDRAGVSVG
jgi:acyl carrier protein